MRQFPILALITLTSCTISISRDDQIKNLIQTPPLEVSQDEALEEPFFKEGEWPSRKWWEQYQIAELNQLVEKALQKNPTIQQVKARIDYAKSQAQIARSYLLPSLYFDFDYNWDYLSQNGLYRALNPHMPLNTNLIDFTLSFFYEFDFWGKYRSLYRAALGREKAAVAEWAQSELITSASLSQAYFALRTNLLRKKIYEQIYEVRKKYFELQVEMLNNSLYSKLVPLLSEEEVEQAKQWLYSIEQEIEVGKHLVNILTGVGPDEPLALNEPLKPLPKKIAIPSDISIELLARRPDVMAQVWQVEALALDVGAARAEYWPNIGISATAGQESTSWFKLFNFASSTAGVKPALDLPIYTAGELGGNVDAKMALFNEAVNRYNDLVLLSFQQVADLLSIGESVYGQKVEQVKIVDQAKARYGLTLMRQQSGIDSALTAYRFLEELLQKQLEEVHLLFQQYVVTISLARALGGGNCFETPNGWSR